MNHKLLFNSPVLSVAIRIVALPIVNYLHFVFLYEVINFLVGLTKLDLIVAPIDENLENDLFRLKFNLLRLVQAKKLAEILRRCERLIKSARAELC